MFPEMLMNIKMGCFTNVVLRHRTMPTKHISKYYIDMTLNVHRSHLPVSCGGRCQCLPRPLARHLGRVCSVSSEFSCPYLAPPLTRVFLCLLPVITLLRGSSSPCPHARHHSALWLVSSVEAFSEGGRKCF